MPLVGKVMTTLPIPNGVMAGLVPAIPIGKARRSSDRDHRHRAGNDKLGIGAACSNDKQMSVSLNLKR
jgi:hypothetical protein